MVPTTVKPLTGKSKPAAGRTIRVGLPATGEEVTVGFGPGVLVGPGPGVLVGPGGGVAEGPGVLVGAGGLQQVADEGLATQAVLYKGIVQKEMPVEARTQVRPALQGLEASQG